MPNANENDPQKPYMYAKPTELHVKKSLQVNIEKIELTSTRSLNSVTINKEKWLPTQPETVRRLMLYGSLQKQTLFQ